MVSSQKSKEEEEETPGGSNLSNFFMQQGQHLGAHVIGFHGGLIQLGSSGGDVALRCCHIDAN